MRDSWNETYVVFVEGVLVSIGAMSHARSIERSPGQAILQNVVHSPQTIHLHAFVFRDAPPREIRISVEKSEQRMSRGEPFFSFVFFLLIRRDIEEEEEEEAKVCYSQMGGARLHAFPLVAVMLANVALALGGAVTLAKTLLVTSRFFHPLTILGSPTITGRTVGTSCGEGERQSTRLMALG